MRTGSFGALNRPNMVMESVTASERILPQSGYNVNVKRKTPPQGGAQPGIAKIGKM